MTQFSLQVPAGGTGIVINDDLSLTVPDQLIVPFIEGDGIGADVLPVMRKVVDAAVMMAYNVSRKIHWMEIYSGEKAAQLYDGEWYPTATLDAIKQFTVVVKGPEITPIGEGFRSLNIALRHEFDLYAVMRPIRWLRGMPAPVVAPQDIHCVIFRENSEDVYAGIEWRANSPQANKVIQFLRDEIGVKKIRYADDCAIGIKHVSAEASKRLVRRAIRYAIDHSLPSVTLAHKGDTMRCTEGAFRQWGYEVAAQEFGATPIDDISGMSLINPVNGTSIVINDILADTLLQRLLTRPSMFSVIAALNMNGDYLADLLTAQCGGIGIMPSANIGDSVAVFEVTHGPALASAGTNTANPIAIILAGEMLLRHIGWNEAAEILVAGLNRAIESKQVTTDIARVIPGARVLTCSEFGAAVISQMAN
jgi:isocitrate dehydrogenase